MKHWLAVGCAVVLGLAGLPAWAQNVISTQAGLINFTEGPVAVNGAAFRPQPGQFRQLREQDTLETGALGRAEVLLSPGVFLRMGHDSAFRLTSGKVWDARLELLSGTALVEAAEIGRGNRLTMAHGGATVTIEKSGLYRLDAEPAALRVLSGKAVVEASGKKYEVKGGRMLALTGQAAVTKFDRKRQDSLDAWSERRSARLAQANMAGTRSIAGERDLPRSGFWLYNGLMGTFTFIPASLYYTSPYGFYFWRDYYQQQAVAAAANGGSGGATPPSLPAGGSPGGAVGSAGAGSYSGGGGGVGGNYGGGGGAARTPGGSPAANPQ